MASLSAYITCFFKIMFQIQSDIICAWRITNIQNAVVFVYLLSAMVGCEHFVYTFVLDRFLAYTRRNAYFEMRICLKTNSLFSGF